MLYSKWKWMQIFVQYFCDVSVCGKVMVKSCGGFNMFFVQKMQEIEFILVR